MNSMRSFVSITFLSTLLLAATAQSGLILSPGAFTLPATVINYSNSPVGNLPGGTSITTQYATLGVLHDGSTTTPPGPPGMSSDSGLPGLESPVGDPDPFLPISMSFTVPVTQVGAYYLMGVPTDSITITAFRLDNTVIETATVLPASMPLRPGPFGFNEGFLGLITTENIAKVTFTPTTNAFVVDDFRFAGAAPIPEPATIGFGLLVLGVCCSSRVRPTGRNV
jgi:hypothetical protein